MEVLELVAVLFINIATVVFDPFIYLYRLAKSFWDYMSPDNLPEQLTFDEFEEQNLEQKHARR